MPYSQKLHASKDKTVFKLMEKLAKGEETDEASGCEPRNGQVKDHTSQGRVGLLRELIRRLGTHTPTGEFVDRIVKRW
jgi:hypothetical protein